jgi:hypothetical protein
VGTPIRGGRSIARQLAVCCTLAEGAGATAHDSTLYRRHGVLSGGASWVTPRAVAFSGAAGQVVSGPSPLGGAGQATILVRVWQNSSGGSPAGCWMGTDVGYGSAYFIGRDNGGSGSSTAGQMYVNATKTNFTVAFDTWQDVVAVINGSTLSIYVQGVLTATNGTISAIGAHTQYQVGTDTATNLPMAGKVGQYALWSRALSAAEVRSLYLAPYQLF